MSLDTDVAMTAPNGANGHVNGNGGDVQMSDDDDIPLVSIVLCFLTEFPNKALALFRQSVRKSDAAAPSGQRTKRKIVYAESSSDDDVPLASSPAKREAKTNGASKTAASGAGGKTKANKAPPKKKLKVEEEEDYSDDELAPPKKKPAPRKRKVKAESDAELSGDEPPKKKPPAKKVKKEEPAASSSSTETAKPKKTAVKDEDDGPESSPTKGKGKKKGKKEEDEEEVFRWWDDDVNGDGSVKWTTLEHNGVMFPPPYEPLPASVKMKYNGESATNSLRFDAQRPAGKSVNLPPESEEVAGFYGAMIETDHAQDATFNKNFFDDWKTVLKKHPPVSTRSDSCRTRSHSP